MGNNGFVLRNIYLAGFIVLSVFVSGQTARAQHAMEGRQVQCDTAVNGKEEALQKIRMLVSEIVERSFPELDGRSFRFGTFSSESTYFKTRFSFTRLFTFRRTGFVLDVNPAVFALCPPPEGLPAIIAHELAHAEHYRRNGGFKLFGLIKLADSDSLAKFERRADLTAIAKGYGPGLKIYREWLYRNIPEKHIAKKKRNYFTPEEIEMISEAFESSPSVIIHLSKKVPLTPSETSAYLAGIKSGT